MLPAEMHVILVFVSLKTLFFLIFFYKENHKIQGWHFNDFNFYSTWGKTVQRMQELVKWEFLPSGCQNWDTPRKQAAA